MRIIFILAGVAVVSWIFWRGIKSIMEERKQNKFLINAALAVEKEVKEKQASEDATKVVEDK